MIKSVSSLDVNIAKAIHLMWPAVSHVVFAKLQASMITERPLDIDVMYLADVCYQKAPTLAMWAQGQGRVEKIRSALYTHI